MERARFDHVGTDCHPDRKGIVAALAQGVLYRVEAVGILDKQKRVQVMTGHQKVEVPIIEKKSAQVLSVSENTAQIMDLETYETFDAEIGEEVKGKINEGETVMYWDILGTRVIKQVK